MKRLLTSMLHGISTVFFPRLGYDKMSEFREAKIRPEGRPQLCSSTLDTSLNPSIAHMMGGGGAANIMTKGQIPGLPISLILYHLSRNEMV